MSEDSDPEEERDEIAALFEEARPSGDDLVERVIRDNVRRALFGEDIATSAPALGRLTIISPIGTGAMGSVLEAHDPVLDRRVAVKILHQGTEATREKALREARHLAKLSHENVVGVFDVGSLTEPGEEGVYLVMEYVQGTTLRLWADEPRSIDDVLRVLCAAGEGIAAAHEADILHRDIKAENILVGEEGRVKIADFGVAEARDSGGRLAGTPGYIAPELLAGEAASQRSDQFSFFVTLRETFERAGVEIPKSLMPVIERGASDVPGDRYPSMRAALDALRPKPRASTWRWVAVAAFAAMTVAAIAFLVDGGNPLCDQVLGERHPWPSEARAQLRAQIESVEGFGAAALQQLFHRLDENAARWTTTRDEVCGAQLPPEVLSARAACLVHEREQIKAWARGAEDLRNVSEFSRVAGALERVSDPGRCATVEGNEDGRHIDPADERAESTLIRDGHGLLAEVEVSLALGAYPVASFILDAVNGTTADADDATFVARRSYLNGRMAARSGDADAAEALFETAMENAALAGASRLEAEIWLGIVRNELLSGSPSRALEWSPFATAALSRARMGIRELAGMEGEAHAALGDFEEAKARLIFALEGQGESALRPVRRAIATMNLGRIAVAEDRPAEALRHFEEALAIAEDALGDGHPGRAMYIDQRGRARLAAGDVEGAITDHQRAIAIRSEAYGEDDRAVASSLMRVAEASLEGQDLEEAESHLQRAAAIRHAIYGDDPGRAVPVNSLRGRLAMARGDAGEARRLLEGVVTHTRPERAEDARTALSLLGRALLGSGEHEGGASIIAAASEDAADETLRPSEARCALWSTATRLEAALSHIEAGSLRRGERLCAGVGARTLLARAEARVAAGESAAEDLGALARLPLTPRIKARVAELTGRNR